MSQTHVQKLYATGAGAFDRLMSRWVKAVATEAEEDLRTFLRSNLDRTKTLLELGCGTGRNLRTIYSLGLEFGKYLGIDFSPQMVAVARQKFPDDPDVEFEIRDITSVGYTPEKFDIILCTWVLSHIQSPSVLVNKTQGLLNHGGKLFLVFLTRPKWYIDFWFYPISRFFFSAKPVGEGEVRKFANIKVRHSYSANITTVVEIWKREQDLPTLG